MICGHRLNQKMNMILIGPNLQKLHLIPFLNIYTLLLQTYFIKEGAGRLAKP